MSKTISTAIVGPVSLALTSDNPLTITGTGAIISASDGIDGSASMAWTITNGGEISSVGGFGIRLTGSGNVTNQKGASILSGYAGVYIGGGSGTVTNAGIINASEAVGVSLKGNNDAVNNEKGALIEGGEDGVVISDGTTGMATNAGTIIGGSGVGLDFSGVGGTVNNEKGGLIEGGYGGLFIGGGGLGTVDNDGSISSVALFSGGTVNNEADGSINSLLVGGLTGTIANQGTILNGIDLYAGGTINNERGGSIPGGIVAANDAATIINSGVISSGPGEDGIFMTNGGSVTNEKGGLITGQFRVIEIGGGIGAFSNSGTITGTGDGVFLWDGGSASNSGVISVAWTGLAIVGGTSAATLINSGAISGAQWGGVSISGVGGNVTNKQGAYITSSDATGVNIETGSGTVTNAGIISGAQDSVSFWSGSANNRLIIDPGAVFVGAADATAATNSTIELAKGIGAISGIGTGNFDGFNALDVDSSGAWTMSGTGNTMATVLNDGKLEVAGQLDVSTAIDQTSTGMFILDAGSTLDVAQALGTSTRMSFDAGSELIIDNCNLFGQNVGMKYYAGSLLMNFGGCGTIDLKDFSTAGMGSSISNANGITQLQLTNGTEKATLNFQKTGLGQGGFQFASDQNGGVLITHA